MAARRDRVVAETHLATVAAIVNRDVGNLQGGLPETNDQVRIGGAGARRWRRSRRACL